MNREGEVAIKCQHCPTTIICARIETPTFEHWVPLELWKATDEHRYTMADLMCPGTTIKHKPMPDMHRVGR